MLMHFNDHDTMILFCCSNCFAVLTGEHLSTHGPDDRMHLPSFAERPEVARGPEGSCSTESVPPANKKAVAVARPCFSDRRATEHP